jgi:hypothetical protein
MHKKGEGGKAKYLLGKKKKNQPPLQPLIVGLCILQNIKKMEMQVGTDRECIPHPIQVECGTQTC